MAVQSEQTTGDDAVTRASDAVAARTGVDPRAVASDIAAQAPNVVGSAMGTAAGALNESAARIQSSSDETLAIGTALSAGVAIGLILGGANRLLVGMALIPTAGMGFTLLSRYNEGQRASGSATRKGG